MNGFYKYLEEIMPVKRLLISLAVGMVSLGIVLYSGLTSDFVRTETVASRAFSAFSFTGLATFILMMSCEEYAIFKTKRELENFIDAAPEAETNEEFNLAQYRSELYPEPKPEKPKEPEESAEPADSFRPMDFNAL